MARRHNIVRRRSPNKDWIGSVDTANAIAGGGTKVLLSTAVFTFDTTVLRTLGVLGIATDQNSTTEQQEGALGMIVVSDAAIAAGVASIPGPITDIDNDGWFLHVPFLNEFKLVPGVGFNPLNTIVREFDFKSKRKIEDGFSIAVVIESTTTSEGFTASLIFRMLTMLRGTG